MSRRTLTKLRKMLKDEKQRLLITLELLADGRFQELGLDHPCKIVAALAALHDQLVRLVEGESNVSSSQQGSEAAGHLVNTSQSDAASNAASVGGSTTSPIREIEKVETYKIPPVESWEDVYAIINAALGARRVSRLPLAVLVKYGVHRLRDLYLAGLIDLRDYALTLMLYDTTRIT